MDEILLIDKPAGWTSFDVVAKIRNQLRQNFKSQSLNPKKLKVGHAGTLDPFATGLLIILLGKKCKEADKFLKLDKTYEFTMKLGEVSTTGDPEGQIRKAGGRRPEIEEINQVLGRFTGEITQMPPAFSAIKVGGKRAYKLAREGKVVELPERKVKVYSLQLTSYEYPLVRCEVDVSSGTYIRSLVQDIGEALGTGSYCTGLRRTRIGNFSIEQSITVDDFIARGESEESPRSK